MKMTESSVQWLSVTPKLLEGIAISNSIENTKFTLLLTRLFKASQMQIENPFTEDELKKLETSLKLSEEQLKLSLSSLAYLTKKSTHFIMKPTFLQENLIEQLKFDLNKAESFVKLWTECTKADFDDLQQRQVLDKLSWELNLEVASDNNLKKAIPISLLQFHVKDSGGKSENVTVEMDEEQLLELYTQMENIQTVLDSLNK